MLKSPQKYLIKKEFDEIMEGSIVALKLTYLPSFALLVGSVREMGARVPCSICQSQQDQHRYLEN